MYFTQFLKQKYVKMSKATLRKSGTENEIFSFVRNPVF